MAGVKLRFDKVPGSFLLDPRKPEKEYPIPVFKNPQQANYIRVKNGKGSFHWSDSMRNQFHGTGHGHFWRIPQEATAFQFPYLSIATGGWHYGNPRWI